MEFIVSLDRDERKKIVVPLAVVSDSSSGGGTSVKEKLDESRELAGDLSTGLNNASRDLVLSTNQAVSNLNRKLNVLQPHFFAYIGTATVTGTSTRSA